MKYTLLALVSILFMSCSLNPKEPENIDYTVKNDQQIVAYLAANDLTATKSSTGLYYIINEPGTDAQPTYTSDVTVAYKGYYLDGTILDESDAEGIAFNLQNVIYGWTEGITYLKEGGSAILLIPSHLAYGSYNYNGIPGGSVLIFEVKLISVN
jgi:FKBP-type peptidyl-prolyl cis-trans isomerase